MKKVRFRTSYEFGRKLPLFKEKRIEFINSLKIISLVTFSEHTFPLWRLLERRQSFLADSCKFLVQFL